jgi:hypothetical protein
MNTNDPKRPDTKPLAFDPADADSNADPELAVCLSALGIPRGWVILAPACSQDGTVIRYGVTDHPPVSKDTDPTDLISVALRAGLHHDTERDTYETLLFSGRQVGAEFERTRVLGRSEWPTADAALTELREMIVAPEAWTGDEDRDSGG